MKRLIQAGLALAVGFGALAAAPRAALAGPPCPKDYCGPMPQTINDCDSYLPASCPSGGYNYDPAPPKQAEWRNFGFRTVDSTSTRGGCLDCDGQLEGADGHGPGACLKHETTLTQTNYICWVALQKWDADEKEWKKDVVGKSGNCSRVQESRGLTCP